MLLCWYSGSFPNMKMKIIIPSCFSKESSMFYLFKKATEYTVFEHFVFVRLGLTDPYSKIILILLHLTLSPNLSLKFHFLLSKMETCSIVQTCNKFHKFWFKDILGRQKECQLSPFLSVWIIISTSIINTITMQVLQSYITLWLL